MSGVAQFWYCTGAGAVVDFHQQQSADGRFGEYPMGKTGRLGDCCAGGDAQYLAVGRNRSRFVKQKGLRALCYINDGGHDLGPFRDRGGRHGHSSLHGSRAHKLCVYPNRDDSHCHDATSDFAPLIVMVPVIPVAPAAAIPVVTVVIAIANLQFY